MKKPIRIVLFVLTVLTLLIATVLVASAAAQDGDTPSKVAARGETFSEENYTFRVTNASGGVVGYYVNLGSDTSGVLGGAWSAVPEGGKLVFLKNKIYTSKATLYLYNGNSFTVEGSGKTLTQANMKIYNGTATTANTGNTIRWQNLTVTTTNCCAFELCGVGTTYEFDSVTTSITSYGLHINGKGATVKLLGDGNNMKATGGEMFHYKAPATVIVEGGTYTNTGNHHHVKFAVGNTLSNAFDCVFTVKGGSFTRSSTGGTKYHWALIGVYTNTVSGQINISGGTFVSNGKALVMAYSGTLMDLNISGGTFCLNNTAGEALIYLPTDPAYTVNTKKTIGGVSMQTSIEITGGVFETVSTDTPIIKIGSTEAAFGAEDPLKISVANAELINCGALLSFSSSGHYEVELKDITGTVETLVEGFGTTNVKVEMKDCSFTAKQALFSHYGTGALDVTVSGGTQTVQGVMWSASALSAAQLTLTGALLVLTDSADSDVIVESATTKVSLISTVILSGAARVVWDRVSFGDGTPEVKFGGKNYYSYVQSAPTAAFDLATDRVGAGIYIGTDVTKSGIRFCTALSDEAIAALLSLKGAGATLTFGTLIAPADYVAAARAFTREALDVLEFSPAYADIVARHSIRDANADGIPESFSAALVAIKRINYSRYFAAIPYVTVVKDGQSTTYYGSFNTTDHVRSISRLAASELSRVSAVADAEHPYPSIYSLGQYSAYGEEEQRMLGAYLTEPLSQRIEVSVGTSRLLFEGAEKYSWSSGDETVAKIENGVLTALLPGTVTLTAYYEESDTVMTYTLNVTRPATGAATFPVYSDAELTRALRAAQNGDSICVCADLTLSSTVALTKSVRLTSKGAHTVTGPVGVATLFDVSAACSLVFDGSMIYRQQGVTGTSGIMINVSAAVGTVTLTVNGGTFYALAGSVIEHTGACVANINLNGGTLCGLFGVRSAMYHVSVAVNGATILLAHAASDFVGAGIHVTDGSTVSFTKGEIRSCEQGDEGFNAADGGLDIGINLVYGVHTTSISGEARIVTNGMCIYASDVCVSTMIISGGYFTSEKGHVVYFDADDGADDTYASRLTITGGTFIGNNTADAALYVTCTNTTKTTGLTRCDIYGGEFVSEKWCAVRASHSGVMNIYGGNFTVTGSDGGVVVAGTGSARAYVTIYGGTYYHGSRSSGCIFLNGSNNTTLTIKGDFNAIGGAKILKSNASTTILGSPERDYDQNLHYVNDSIYMWEGARIRLSSTASGLTFTGVVPQDVIDTIIANGGSNLSYGTLITLAESLYRAKASFTVAELERHGIIYQSIPASDGLVARDAAEGGGYYIQASLTGISVASYMREYAAVVYVKYTVNGYEVTQYATYDAEKNAISPTVAASVMLENEGSTMSDAEKTIVSQFLANATVNGISVDAYTILTDDTSVAWSEQIVYLKNALLDVTGHSLNVNPYTAAAASSGRCVILRGSTSLAKMAYEIALSGDDVYITVGSDAAAMVLVLAFMENNVKANDGNTIVVTFTAKSGLVGRDYKIARTAGSTIRMMTYNTLGCGTFGTGSDKGDYITATMAAYAPDFIGTQEHYGDTATFAALSSIGYAKAASVVTSLAPDYDIRDEQEFGGIGKETSTEILYLSTRWELVEDGAFRYHWEYRCAHTGTKSVSFGVFRSLETGELVLVINFHGAIFLSDYKNHASGASCTSTASNGVEGRAWRLANAKTIVAFFDSLREKYPGILTGIMGDFNSTVTEDATKVFERNEALTNVLNLLDAADKTPGGSSHSVGQMPGVGNAPIDHIFLTEDVAIAKKHIIVQDPITVEGSDHSPVVVDLARK